MKIKFVWLFALFVFVISSSSGGTQEWRWRPIPDLFTNHGPVCESKPKNEYEIFVADNPGWYNGACRDIKIFLPVDSQQFKVIIDHARGIQLRDWDTGKTHSIFIENGPLTFDPCLYRTSDGPCPGYQEFVPHWMFRNLGNSRRAYSNGSELHVLIEKKFGVIHIKMDAPFENALYFFRQVRFESKIIHYDSEDCRTC